MAAADRAFSKEKGRTYSPHAQDLAYLLAAAIEEGCTDVEVSTEYGTITAKVRWLQTGEGGPE